MRIRSWKNGLVLGVAALTLGTAGWALAGPHGHHGGRGGPGVGRALHRLIRVVDLTEEQEVMAVRLSRSIREDAEAARKEHRAKMIAIARKVAGGETDPGELHALVDSLGQARNAMGHRVVDAFLQLEGTFTDAQREELEDVVDRWLERSEGRE